MRLTTLARIRSRTLQQTTEHDSIINRLVNTVSHQIETWLGRHILKVSRTEQYDIDLGQQLVALRGYPVETSPAAQFRDDISRGFTSSAMSSDSYFVDNELGLVKFDRIALSYGVGVFQAIYTGGLAYTLDRIQMTVSGAAGAPTVGDTVTGGTSGATGVAVSLSGTTLILTVDTDGNFEVGDVVTSTGFSATIASIDRRPLLVAFPEIVEACELQVIFDYQRKDQIGLSSLSIEGGSASFEPPMRFLKGVEDLLEPHRSRIERR